MSVRADVETFKNIPIFSECDGVHLQLLAFSAVRQNFEPGTAVIQQGGNGSAAFLILNGDVQLSTSEVGPVGTAGPGALLGEVSMIGERPYSLTAKADGLVTVVRIDRELFMRVATEFPDFGKAVFRVLAQNLDSSTGEFNTVREAFETARSFKNL